MVGFFALDEISWRMIIFYQISRNFHYLLSTTPKDGADPGPIQL